MNDAGDGGRPPPTAAPVRPGGDPDGGWEDASITVGDLSPSLPTEPFDPEPGRERIRGRFAACLLGAVLLGSFGLAGCVVRGVLELATAKELATVFLTPLFGLASAAIGFYYAASGKR